MDKTGFPKCTIYMSENNTAKCKSTNICVASGKMNFLNQSGNTKLARDNTCESYVNIHEYIVGRVTHWVTSFHLFVHILSGQFKI